MAITPGNQPSGGGTSVPRETDAYSGTRDGTSDATNEPGQYPPGDWGTAIFGGPLPDGTGAPGTRGANQGDTDPTNEPGQTQDGLTGISEQDITQTGAPGTGTTPNDQGGAASISYTRPGSYLTGTYQTDTYNDDIQGPRDSTQANDEGYATGGPQLPGLKGNEPVPGGRFQPGSGRVLRGGRAVNP
jgi:hypothetical protein